MRILLRFLLITALSGALLIATGLALIPPARALLGSTESGTADISLTNLDERSYVYAADGSLLATLHVEQNRAPVTLDQVPQHVIDAILAVEDSEFYAHDGVNVRATMRALLHNSAGDSVQGGSTITQQLVKQTLVGSKRNLDRKAREAILAVRLEDQMTKDEILGRYVNTVYFGNGAYGVQAAAETYFGTDVDKLDTGQAALLAGLISSPERADPFRFPKNALERRRLALRRLAVTGHITEAEAAFYQGIPLPAEPFKVTPPPNDYFVEEVKQSLLEDKRLGETQSERYNAVFRGGLRIYTTFDPHGQELALQSRDDVLGSIAPDGFPAGTFPLPNDPETGDERFGTAAIVSVEPSTGAVRVMVGGPGFDKYKYNLATQGIGRQPGSSFKTFVMAALMENGYVPSDSVDGHGPCTFKIPGIAEPYEVSNFDNSRGGGGNITSQALRSSNCAFVRLGQIVGLDNVADTAHKMGITTPLDPSFFSMPLGSLEVHPIDMAGAYATIANDGIANAPYLIERVDGRDGATLFEHKADGRRAISVQSARLVAQILQKNVEGGTGTRARLPGRPAAGKTGTAQDSGDAWFVGFTPQLSTAVWMGSPVGRVGMRIGGRGVTGGSYPAMMWNKLMAPYHEGLEVESFTAPGPTRKGTYLRVDKTVDAKASSKSSSTRKKTTATTAKDPASSDGPTTTSPPPPSPPTTGGGPPPTGPLTTSVPN